MTIIDRRTVITVGQMPFAAGYINQRANIKRYRQLARKRTFRKLAAKFGMRAGLDD